MRHYLDNRIMSQGHRVGVILVGAGGTGSQVLSGLARIHHSLCALGMSGLHVTVFDDDEVSESNLGRQNFARADVGESKAGILVSRINAYFGLDWLAYPLRYPMQDTREISFLGHQASTQKCRNSDVAALERRANILITCVDTASARLAIAEYAKGGTADYWLDFGNTRDSAQVVLGTFHPLEQPNSAHALAGHLPTILDLYPNLVELDEADDTPSCSVREALLKQDLFINATVANMGCSLLWQFLKNGFIERHGFFLNTTSLITSPLLISHDVWGRFGWTVPPPASALAA